MTGNWKEYQEEAAAFFRSVGLEATTDVTIHGVRTSHDIDVLVKSFHAGFSVTWVVECKCWSERVSKVHVLALREIVTDVGADRGIILSEMGFQSGAIEAAKLTNVRPTSLADLRKTASAEVMSIRVSELYDRVESCRVRYWNIEKEERIEHGLREDVFVFGYSGNRVLEVANELLSMSLRGVYPIRGDSVAALTMPGFDRQFASAAEVVAAVEPIIVDLERRLDAYEVATKSGSRSGPQQPPPIGA